MSLAHSACATRTLSASPACAYVTTLMLQIHCETTGPALNLRMLGAAYLSPATRRFIIMIRTYATALESDSVGETTQSEPLQPAYSGPERRRTGSQITIDVVRRDREHRRHLTLAVVQCDDTDQRQSVGARLPSDIPIDRRCTGRRRGDPTFRS